MVRERSAKPLYVGSIPTRASNSWHNSATEVSISSSLQFQSRLRGLSCVSGWVPHRVPRRYHMNLEEERQRDRPLGFASTAIGDLALVDRPRGLDDNPTGRHRRIVPGQTPRVRLSGAEKSPIGFPMPTYFGHDALVFGVVAQFVVVLVALEPRVVVVAEVDRSPQPSKRLRFFAK